MENKPPTCTWTGVSGQKYTYHVYPWAPSFREVPGNYVFTKLNAQGRHSALYFGESEDLKNRCCGTHHTWDAAVKAGATHIQAHASSTDRKLRCAEETDLIHRYKPPLNKQ